MKPRLDYNSLTPMLIKKMVDWHLEIKKGSLPTSVLNLVFLRASQINGCAYCVSMHTREALKDGETNPRLHAVVAWEDSPLFNAKERAALKWTESVTRVSETHVPDSDYEIVRGEFNEKEVVELTMAIASINAWNRLGVSFRSLPGD